MRQERTFESVFKVIRRAQGSGGLGSQRLGADQPLADAEGASTISKAMRGETNQWAPLLYDGTTQV